MTGAATDQGVLIGLSVVVFALRDGEAVVLTADGGAGAGLPFGPFQPERHRTFELALRDFVAEQTAFPLGYVEQLYTFGDEGRDSPRAEMGAGVRRVVSVGYLALTPEPGEVAGAGAAWTPVLDFFPWEDRRDGPSPMIAETIVPLLDEWAGRGDTVARRDRIRSLFAVDHGQRWNEQQVLERYELLYEADLVAEARRDHAREPGAVRLGRPMASDHRRILATALGRLRSKMKYRPVLFDLTPDIFTLSELQGAAEAISGLALHKQNFRRGVERTGLVEATGRLSAATGGRPAELYRYRGAGTASGAISGLSLPALR